MRAIRAQEPSRARFVWKFATSCAMVMLLVLGIYTRSVQVHKQERLAALRAEQRRIESELRHVKAMADDVPPVVVLENNDTRVIVDLDRTQKTYY